MTVESIQLLDANPERFLRMITQSRALTVGDPDFELPKGNDYAGILMFEPDVADAGVATGNIRDVRLLVDEVEFGIANARFEAMRDGFEYKGKAFDSYGFDALPPLANYGFIDFDPLKDDSYLLPTIGRSSVKLRPTLDGAETIRVVPIELVRVEPLRTGGVTGGA